jgi:GNAT superfamily N-acetyltransferase
MPALKENTSWVAWDDAHQDILALAQADIYLTGDNPRVVWFNIEVLPNARRQGLGRELLRRVARHAREQGRSLLTVDCHDRTPDGSAFLARIGAIKGLVEAVNQVRVAELDRELIGRWLEHRASLSAEFELGFWDVPYPKERLQDLADLLQEVANDQPRDSLQMDDLNYTPELMQQFDDEQRAGGDQRWTLYAVNRLDDRLAGITEVYWNPNRPEILWQGFTGVMPAFRNRGLGRWLKAEMLTRVLRDRPQLQVIRSGNADSNAPMLKINRALGFQRFVEWATWQVELEQVEQYLEPTA